jgi:hypothetical protein
MAAGETTQVVGMPTYTFDGRSLSACLRGHYAGRCQSER